MRTFPDIDCAQADLHLHSTASDGLLSPAQLMQTAQEAGLQVVGLTDHETLGGLDEAAQAAHRLGLTLIPGVEINTMAEDEVHILLYFVHEGMQELGALLQKVQQDRQDRCALFLERFRDLGKPISLEDLRLQPGTFCHRPHVADALLRRGYVTSRQEAFDRYLAAGKPGYVPRLKVDTQELLQLARRCGAVPVLAHPALIKKPALKDGNALAAYKEAGLLGIEAYHSKHSDGDCKHYLQLARSLGLTVTGGSDYHADPGSEVQPGNQRRRWQTAGQDVRALISLRTM